LGLRCHPDSDFAEGYGNSENALKHQTRTVYCMDE
jgi:hypothetical protein